jgi:hypothetical protein
MIPSDQWFMLSAYSVGSSVSNQWLIQSDCFDALRLIGSSNRSTYWSVRRYIYCFQTRTPQFVLAPHLLAGDSLPIESTSLLVFHDFIYWSWTYLSSWLIGSDAPHGCSPWMFVVESMLSSILPFISSNLINPPIASRWVRSNSFAFPIFLLMVRFQWVSDIQWMILSISSPDDAPHSIASDMMVSSVDSVRSILSDW